MKRNTLLVLSLLIGLSMILAACKPVVTETEPPAVTEAPVVDKPTEAVVANRRTCCPHHPPWWLVRRNRCLRLSIWHQL